MCWAVFFLLLFPKKRWRIKPLNSCCCYCCCQLFRCICLAYQMWNFWWGFICQLTIFAAFFVKISEHSRHHTNNVCFFISPKKVSSCDDKAEWEIKEIICSNRNIIFYLHKNLTLDAKNDTYVYAWAMKQKTTQNVDRCNEVNVSSLNFVFRICINYK